ncbi:DUF4931 domain-containing protein [uncultured Anaerovibrio sp.]|uniref:DUF4931 domain-containing protein n=1 Tax=uncultured Anaerovibrio sp. TaxID=361586 RepID=UPI002604B9F2|nr:DUF4931 domain-containing protein [uncultured Anaerovibrio sp.]
MEINIINFNTTIGVKKPRTIQGIANTIDCPFCDVEHLVNIIDTDDNIILLKNKYNVMEPSDQLVLIETDQCKSDIPDYPKEQMRRVIHMGVKHWIEMLNCGKYRSVIFFKNFGPMSGGTIQHPHMQLVGYPELDPELMFDPVEFEGLKIYERQGVELNTSTNPRIGFSEYNLVLHDEAYAGLETEQAALTPREESLNLLADLIKETVTFMKNYFKRPNFSYNLFFYNVEKQMRVKIMPRFATPPMYVGYNIHLRPTSIPSFAENLKNHLKEQGYFQ